MHANDQWLREFVFTQQDLSQRIVDLGRACVEQEIDDKVHELAHIEERLAAFPGAPDDPTGLLLIRRDGFAHRLDYLFGLLAQIDDGTANPVNLLRFAGDDDCPTA